MVETLSRRQSHPSRRLQSFVSESTTSTDTNEPEVETYQEDLARVKFYCDGLDKVVNEIKKDLVISGYNKSFVFLLC